MHLQIDAWNPVSNLLLLSVCISSFVVPFACCLFCSSFCKLAIPEVKEKMNLNDKMADEEGESTTVTGLEYYGKYVDIQWV